MKNPLVLAAIAVLILPAILKAEGTKQETSGSCPSTCGLATDCGRSWIAYRNLYTVDGYEDFIKRFNEIRQNAEDGKKYQIDLSLLTLDQWCKEGGSTEKYTTLRDSAKTGKDSKKTSINGGQKITTFTSPGSDALKAYTEGKNLAHRMRAEIGNHVVPDKPLRELASKTSQKSFNDYENMFIYDLKVSELIYVYGEGNNGDYKSVKKLVHDTMSTTKKNHDDKFQKDTNEVAGMIADAKNSWSGSNWGKDLIAPAAPETEPNQIATTLVEPTPESPNAAADFLNRNIGVGPDGKFISSPQGQDALVNHITAQGIAQGTLLGGGTVNLDKTKVPSLNKNTHKKKPAATETTQTLGRTTDYCQKNKDQCDTVTPGLIASWRGYGTEIKGKKTGLIFGVEWEDASKNGGSYLYALKDAKSNVNAFHPDPKNDSYLMPDGLKFQCKAPGAAFPVIYIVDCSKGSCQDDPAYKSYQFCGISKQEDYACNPTQLVYNKCIQLITTDVRSSKRN